MTGFFGGIDSAMPSRSNRLIAILSLEGSALSLPRADSPPRTSPASTVRCPPTQIVYTPQSGIGPLPPFILRPSPFVLRPSTLDPRPSTLDPRPSPFVRFQQPLRRRAVFNPL